MRVRSIARVEDGEHKRLVMFLTAEDALTVYQALSGYPPNDSRHERLLHLMEEFYEDATGERLTEPWEWED